MKNTLYITACTLAVIAACSCTKKSDESTYATQETRIETFVSSQMSANDSASVVTNSGSTRLILVEGEGDTLEENGTVSFYYAGYVMTSTSISSSNLFATNREELAEELGWSLSSDDAFDILTVNLAETDLIDGLKNGLIGVQGGEECYILFSGQHGYGGKTLGTISANSALAYHIWVESISND